VRNGSVERCSATELAEHFPVPLGGRSDLLVLRTRVQLEQDELAAIRERINETVAASAGARSPHAPKIPIFRDPPGTSADTVLRNAGCAPFARGSARIGGRSPNLLMMARNTKSSDVADLCRTLVETARSRSGVELESRLVFVDENGRKEEP
jgi:UDP-N-acetylenolpyruvoylglucosamine reductase